MSTYVRFNSAWALRLLPLTVLVYFFVTSSCSSTRIPEVYTRSDVSGEWQAVYQELRVMESETNEVIYVSGIETLILKEDGTYIQSFSNSTKSMDKIEAEGAWRIDESGTIHLEEGLWPQLGPNDLPKYREGKYTFHLTIDQKEYVLDGTEVLLFTKKSSSRKIYLEHLPTGDPDSPHIIRLSRVQ